MKNKKQRGITLVALVVTIVILLILAGVTLSMVVGENGIITKAKEARDKMAEAQHNDQLALNEMEGWLNKLLGDNSNPPTDNTISPEEPEPPIEPEEPQLPKNDTTNPYFPEDDWTQVEGTDLDNGLVIEDGKGNQYVWIEVPKTAEVYPTAGINLDINNLTSDNYTAIENDLHTYTNTYRKGTSYKDKYYADSTTGWFAGPTEYNTQKYKMLKSVYENGGFWIGRYEAGIAKNRIASGVATVTPLSQENQYPYTYVTRTQAKVLAEKVNSGNYTSSLMFGVQWDLVLKYIETKQIETNTNIVSQLNNDSRNIGNYCNSTFTINRGKYTTIENWLISSTWKLYTEHTTGFVEGNKKKAKNEGNGVLLTTGASDRNSLQNIYDIAGNASEYTMEYTSDSLVPCTYRGGYHGSTGLDYPASARDFGDTSVNDWALAFRVSLY